MTNANISYSLHKARLINVTCAVITGKPDRPGVPQIMEVMKTKISLSWDAPRSDGGSPIFNYCVEYREEELFKWTRANRDNMDETKYTVKGLKENTVYEFRVAAENKAGTGAYSENTSPVKAEERVGRCCVECRMSAVFFINI